MGCEEVRLEQAVVLQHEVVIATNEWFEDRRYHLTVIEWAENLTNIMQQSNNYVLLILTIAQGPGRRLEAVVAAGDIVRSVLTETV